MKPWIRTFFAIVLLNFARAYGFASLSRELKSAMSKEAIKDVIEKSNYLSVQDQCVHLRFIDKRNHAVKVLANSKWLASDRRADQ